MLPEKLSLSPEIAQALHNQAAVVALESTVITHGLPRPQNLQLAQDLEAQVRSEGAVPATTAVIDGRVHVGLTAAELERLSNTDGTRKISRRDYGIAIARGECGGTTVAGTLIAARAAGIKVFATGGIGGVHRDAPFDVSADLIELSRSPVVVVCAGAKSILDLPATLEVLETQGVPVVGYQTSEFPAFFSASSGLPVNVQVDSAEEAARIALAQWELGINAAVLVVVPPPAEFALPAEEIEKSIQLALQDAQKQNIRGAAVTPFLLSRVSQHSHGSSLQANLALLRNNARVAAKIARAMGK